MTRVALTLALAFVASTLGCTSTTPPKPDPAASPATGQPPSAPGSAVVAEVSAVPQPEPRVPKQVICNAMPIVAEATMLFDPGLAGPGTFDVTVSTEGKSETCTITLGAPRPAVHVGGMVGMGPQDETTTCKLVHFSGTFGDGSLAGLTRDGKPAELKLTIKEGAKVIGDGVFHPDFTPDECGQMKRHQKFPITR
ncbi:MAG: hypothetical protein U0414_02475 [Polyangiaceae bacterium]